MKLHEYVTTAEVNASIASPVFSRNLYHLRTIIRINKTRPEFCQPTRAKNLRLIFPPQMRGVTPLFM